MCPDPQYSDSQREMAAGNLKALAGDVLGGGAGSKGKSGGGSGGGKSGGGAGSPGDFFTQLFHKAVDHLHKGGGQGQQGQGQQQGQPSANTDDPGAPGGGSTRGQQPSQQSLLQTPEQMQSRQDAMQQQAAAIATKVSR